MPAYNDSAALFGSLKDSTLANFFGNDGSPSPEPSSVAATTASVNAGAVAASSTHHAGHPSPRSGCSEPGITVANTQQGPNPQGLADGEAAAAGIAAFYPSDGNWTFDDNPPYDGFGNPYDNIYSPTSAAQFAQPSWPIGAASGSHPDLTFLQQQQQQQQQQQPRQRPQRPMPQNPHTSPSGHLPIAAISPIALEGEPVQHNLPLEVPQGHFRPNPGAQLLEVLTPAQQEMLKNIAMPAHLQYHSPKSEPSPQSSPSDKEKGDSVSSPEAVEPSKGSGRKRKSSAEEEDDDDEDLDGHPVKKTAHNMIEKRYRTNLNDKIAALRDSVPSLRIMSKSARGEDTTEDREELHGLTPAHKLNKATVLSKATEYIRHLEKRNNRLIHENDVMQQRIGAFEKLFMAGAMNGTMSPLQHPPTPIQFPQDAQSYMASPMGTPGRPDPPGLIQVPEDMKRIIQAQVAAGRPYPIGPQTNYQQNAALLRQQQIQQQQQQIQQGRWGESGPYFGKLMVGSLAGLMLFEAVRENEKSAQTPDGRGLFALPLQWIGSFAANAQFGIAGYTFSAAQVLSTLRLFLLFGSLVYVFLPMVSSVLSPMTQNKKKQPQQLQPSPQAGKILLAAVPSLASPIQVRRQAWLTSVQTVWVPRHNFILEAAALMLKTVKLSLRNTIGVRGYQMLTGLTEDQETARVKAWTIALDAQLAGGDVEINRSRLTLTLLASGTLPDTPLRLMLKALHIRVLLWELGEGPRGIHNVVAAKLARSNWNQARQLFRLSKASSPTLSAAPSSCPSQDDNGLPQHLAVLLEQECDDVLNDEIVQRAHNLAWNRPTTHALVADVDGMNSVVEDPAIKSPMDAVAAWWSSLVLHQTLTASLAEELAVAEDATVTADEKTPLPDDSSVDEDDLNLAASVAPVGSNAQVRAIVARAFLSTKNRSGNIVDALEAMDPSCNPDKYPEYSKGVPPLIDSPAAGVRAIYPDPDAKMALHCAMVTAHLGSASPKASALDLVNNLLRGGTDGLTLLGFTAAIRLIVALHQHPVARETCSGSIERLSGALRIWIGATSNDRCALDQTTRHVVVQRCLAITKSIVGMETDPGYASMSECGPAEDSC